jgi:outer membrane receptor for ferrienterochelin and colicin
LAWIDFGGTSGVRPADRRISALNPSFSIARDVGSDQVVLRLNRTQQLFDLRDLDPLVAYVDPDTRSIGNPGLHPQQITSVEAAYDFGKGARSGALTLYYRHARDTLADYSLFLDDNVEVSTKRNFGNAQSYGAEATLSDRLAKTLKFSVTANLFRTLLPQIDADGTGERRSIYSYTGQISWDWTPDATDEFHFDANAQGPTLVPQGEKSGTYVANLVWRHKMSARLTLSLSGQSLLRRHYVRTVLNASTGYDVGRRLNGGRALFAGLKYKID